MTLNAFNHHDILVTRITAAVFGILTDGLRIITVVGELALTNTASVVLRVGAESKASGIRRIHHH